MPRKKRRVYWDASVFNSLFEKSTDPRLQYQRKQARNLLRDARDGHFLVVTSAFTRAEARREPDEPALDDEERTTLSDFFKHNYIELVPVDRAIAELAAEYGERFSLKPADAIQLATAVRAKADVFLAWDRDFHRKVKMHDPPIPVEEPRWTGAKQLALGEYEEVIPAEEDGDM